MTAKAEQLANLWDEAKAAGMNEPERDCFYETNFTIICQS